MIKAPKLRFKEFSGEWESKKLGELDVLLVRGPFGSALKKDIMVPKSDDTYKVYEQKHAIQKDSTLGTYYITKDKYEELKRFSVEPGDYIMSCSGTIGELYKIPDDAEQGVINQALLKIRIGRTLDENYFSYIFKHNLKNLETKGSGIKNVTSIKFLKDEFDIPVPSKEEQEKIASFFSLIDDKISLQGEKLKMLKDYKTGMMQKIFSRELRFKDDEGRDYPEWEEKKLSEVSDVRDGTHDSPKYVEWEEKKLSEVSDVRDGTHDSPKYVESGYRFITSKNLSSNGKIDFSDISYISEEDYININKRSKVDIGDILFGMIGTIGNPVLVEESEFAIKNVALIKEKDDLLNKYLIQVLNSSIISRQFYTLNSGGTQKFIALGVIRDLVIPVPNREEQIKIANFLCNLDKRIDKEQEKLDSLNEYKKGLLQQMFV